MRRRHEEDAKTRLQFQEDTDEDDPHPGMNQNQSQLHPSPLNHPDIHQPEISIEQYPDSSDDNMSIQSYIESNSDKESIASSATSYHSDNHANIVSFVEILLRDSNMERLLAMATSDFGMSPERFTRNFSKILKSYSRHLRQAVEEHMLAREVRNKYLIAAKAVRKSRHQVSRVIASRYNERPETVQDFQQRDGDVISRHLDQPMQADDDQPSSDEASSGDEAEFTTDLEQFLLSGEPFRLLKRNLRSLIISDELFDSIYESSMAFIDLLLAYRHIQSVGDGLRHTLQSGRDVQSDFNVQLRLMASELRAEYNDKSQLDVSIFLETYSSYIYVLAIDHIKTTFTTHGQSTEGSVQMQNRMRHRNVSNILAMEPKGRHTRVALPHEDVLEQIVAETLPSVPYVDLAPHWTFLASSSALQSFAVALHDLAYPTFFSEARRFVKETIRSSPANEDKLLELEGRRLLPILAEMESCMLKGDGRICFATNSPNSVLTAFDRIKLATESSTAAEWDWWPFQPPDRLKSCDRGELSWQCVCPIPIGHP